MLPIDMLVITVIHAGLAISTLAINLYVAHRKFVSNTRNDSSRLRLALASELQNLRELHQDNLHAIYASGDVILSCRLFVTIYRGNLARLHTLDPAEIPALVTAYAMGEKVEAFAAAHCKAHGQNAFSMGKERAFANELVAHYEKARAAADRALRAMNRVDAELIESLGGDGLPELAPPSLLADKAAATA